MDSFEEQRLKEENLIREQVKGINQLLEDGLSIATYYDRKNESEFAYEKAGEVVAKNFASQYLIRDNKLVMYKTNSIIVYAPFFEEALKRSKRKELSVNPSADVFLSGFSFQGVDDYVFISKPLLELLLSYVDEEK